MAEGGGDLLSFSVQKLDKELTCPVCQEHFKEPKVLPCLHYYCKKCVADLISRARGKPFNCPECRREVQAANNDPESFPTAFFVNRMEEVYSVMKKAEPKENVKCENCSEQPSVAFCQHCGEYICENCVRAHKRMRQFSSHVVESIDSLRTSVSKSEALGLHVVAQELKCSKHKNEPLKLYCHTCYKLICRDCIVIDHSGHKYAFVVDIAPQYKSAIKEKATSLQNVSSGLKSALASLADTKKKVSDHGTATMKAIDAAHDKVASKLQQRSKELKEEANKGINTSTEEITVQQKNAQLAMGEVESLLEFLCRNLEKATDQELLSLQKQMSDQADRMAQLYANPVAKFPVPMLPQLEVQCSEDILQVLQNDFSLHNKATTQTTQWKGSLQKLTGQLVMVQKQNADLEAAWKTIKQNEAAIAKLASEKEGLEKELAQLKRKDKIYYGLPLTTTEQSCISGIKGMVGRGLSYDSSCAVGRGRGKCRNLQAQQQRPHGEPGKCKLANEKEGLEKELAQLKRKDKPLTTTEQSCISGVKGMVGRGLSYDSSCAVGRGRGKCRNLQAQQQRPHGEPGKCKLANEKEGLEKELAQLKRKDKPLTTTEQSCISGVKGMMGCGLRAVGRGRGTRGNLQAQEQRPHGLQQLNTRKHKIRGEPVTAEFKPYSKADQEPPPLDFDEEEGPTTIRVSNAPDVSEEALKTFLEGSRGGGCAGAVADVKKISPGVFHVTFHDSKVAAQVMDEESHIFKRTILQLRFVHQKKHSVQEYKPNQLAMHGILEGMEKDVLEVVIAHRLDMEEEDDFDVEISGQSAIITFVNDYTIDDLQQMMIALSSEPVKEVPVTVELCEALKPSIHIRNITTHCDEEFLEFYFSKPKRSGGGEVESIEILSDNEAIITFSDPAVIPSVLGRQHLTLGSTAVLQEVGADTPPSLAQSPISSPPMKPLEVQIDPLFAQSLNKSPSGLEQSIVGSNVRFSVDEKAGLVVFSPTKQPKPNWQEECQEKLSSYIATRLIKEEINVPKEAAAQAMSAVVKLQKENPSLIVIPNRDGTVITVAGELSSVSKSKESIKKICSALITDTVSVVLSPEDFDFVQQMKRSDFPANIECTFDPNAFKILLKGPIGDISHFKESIENFIQHADIPVMLDPLVTQFFSTENGRRKLEIFLQERQCWAALHFNPHPNLTLHLLCKNQDVTSVKVVMSALPLAAIAQAIPVPDTVAPILPDLEEFDQLCQKVEKGHSVLIKHVGHEISAAGFKAEVHTSLAEIDKFLKEKASPLPPAEMRVGSLTAKALHNSQRGIEKQLQPFHVKLQIDVAGGVVQFSPMHYLKPGWEESCKSIVLAYIHANIAEGKARVPQNAFTDVMSVLYASRQDDSTFVFVYPPNSTALAYAGDKRTVKSTEDKIAQLCANYSYKSEEMVLDPEDFEFLCHLKMQDLIGKYRGTVEIEPQHETHTLALSGPVKGVKAMKEYMQSQKAHATVPVTLEPAVVKYFATDEGKEKLFAFLREKRCDKFATYISESPMKLCLLCASKHKKITETAAMALQESTCVLPLQIPDLLLPFLPELPDFIKEVKSLGKENSVQISIEGKQILIAGFQDGVSTSIDTLSAFVKQKVVHFQPICVPVDPLIAKCIVENPVGFHAHMARIQVKCTIETEQSSATAHLSPTKAAKSGWKEECQSELTSYIKANYSREEIEVPKPAAGQVFQLLMTKQKHNVFQFELCNYGSHAIVAGDRNVVKEVQTNISEICNKHQATETMQLSAREYDFFTQVVQPRLQTGVSIEHIPAKHCIVIGGSISEVKDMKNSMKGMIQHSVVPVAVEAMLVELFTTDGKQDLASYVQNKGLQAALHSKLSVYPPSLEFLCDPKLEPSLRDLARKIPEETQVSVMSLPESLTTTPITQEFAEHCKELETQFRVAIKTNQNELRICGFRNPVTDVKKSLESFINKKCSTKKSFPIPTGMWRLFSGPLKPRWMKIELQCQGSKVELPAPVKEEGKFAILLKGDKVEVQKICQSMTQLIQSVATAAIPVSRPGLIKYFSEGEKGRMMIPGIESTHKVCIEVIDVGEEMEMEQTATRSITYGGAPRLVKECVAEVVNMKQISVYTGDITEFRVDVIVNAANEDLKHVGGLADAILKKGGQVIQQESNRYVRTNGQLRAGQVWLSSTVGNLPCLALIHAVGPRWYNNLSNRQQLQKVCMNCFKEAKVYGSIALPAISSGVFGCPIDQCADILISTAVNFCKTPRSGNLQEINFVLFKKTDAPFFIKALQDQLPPQNIRRRSESSAWESSLGASYSTSYVASSAMPYNAPGPAGATKRRDTRDHGNHLTVEVLKGDITQEKTDAIVNPTNREMRLERRGVAGTLLKKAGVDLQKACDEVRARGEYLSEGKVIDTRPGKLKCKRVFHIIFESNNKTVFITVIRSCIERAIQLKFTSIAFPAIGTGMQGFPAAEAAKGMMGALQQCHSPSALSVRIVLFQDDVCSAFKMAFDDQVGDQSGWLQKVGRAVWSIVPSMSWFSPDPLLTEAEDEIKEETGNEIELRIYGETEENVKSAEDSLNKLINMQFRTEDYEDDKIAMLSRMQEKILQEEARRLQLVFDIDRALKYIQLKGSRESISEMKVKIVEILNQVEKEANRKQQAETMMKVVQWKRMDSLQTPYDPLTNLEIEEALRAGKPSYVFRHPQSAESFTIDFQKMEEIDHTIRNQRCRVKCVTIGAESDSGLPDDWEPMIDPKSGKEVSLRVIDLPVISKGYQFALAEFHKTMPQGNYNTIVKIQRIQNPALYGQYIAKKKHLDTHNPKSVQNERWLFHGTTSTAVPQINQTNFNRSFRGQNGTVYGQGIYFARDASYSNRYASADANGLKYMYLVRVLTGEYTPGSSSMIVAPPKDPKDTTVLFDSVVDNTSNPSIYVVFYDADAYPEYLIVYR